MYELEAEVSTDTFHELAVVSCLGVHMYLNYFDIYGSKLRPSFSRGAAVDELVHIQLPASAIR